MTTIDKSVAALRIGRAVREAEQAADQALLMSAGLLQEMMRARLSSDAPAATGQGAILRLVVAQKNLVEASSEILRVHSSLDEVRAIYVPDVHEDCKPSGHLVESQHAA